MQSTSTLRPPAVTRIDYTGTLTKRRAQMITGNKNVQNHSQTEFNRSTNLNYNKCLQVSFTIQTSEFKCSGKQFRVENKLQNNTIDNVDARRRTSHLAHWCEAHLPELHGEYGTHSTDQPGGSGWPIHEVQISSKSSGTHPAKNTLQQQAWVF